MMLRVEPTRRRVSGAVACAFCAYKPCTQARLLARSLAEKKKKKAGDKVSRRQCDAYSSSIQLISSHPHTCRPKQRQQQHRARSHQPPLQLFKPDSLHRRRPRRKRVLPRRRRSARKRKPSGSKRRRRSARRLSDCARRKRRRPSATNSRRRASYSRQSKRQKRQLPRHACRLYCAPARSR